MSRSRQLSVLLIVFGLAMAGCGSDDDPDADPPTTTSPSTETTESPEAQDEAALRQLAEDWHLVVRQITYGEVEFEAAREFAAGEYLDALEADVLDFQSSGNRGERDDRSRTLIESVEVTGDEAVLTECIVDNDVLRNANGEVLNDDVIATRFETTAERSADGWRFTRRDQLGDGTEGESCVE